MLEKEIEKYFKDQIKKQGGRTYKFVSPGNSGVPDRIVFLPGGRLFFIEIKRENEKPRALQKSQIRKLRALGQDVRVLAGIDQVEEFLSEIT